MEVCPTDDFWDKRVKADLTEMLVMHRSLRRPLYVNGVRL